VVQAQGKSEKGADGPHIPFVRLARTARRIFQGEVLVQPYKLRYVLQRMRATAPQVTSPEAH
jgi:hypothetical protein